MAKIVMLSEYKYVTQVGLRADDEIIADVVRARVIRKRLLRGEKAILRARRHMRLTGKFPDRQGPYGKHRILVKRSIGVTLTDGVLIPHFGSVGKTP